MAARRAPSSSAYREHAPLAWFSLGSLAVGGIFYAIGQDQHRPNVSYAAGSRPGLTAAVSAAGLGALLAAGSYFYCVHRTRARDREETAWQASLDGGPDGNGGLAVAARLTFAFSPPRGRAP